MPIAKISWTGELNEREKELLNDLMNLMGMNSAADHDLIPQEMVDVETTRLEIKYGTDIRS